MFLVLLSFRALITKCLNNESNRITTLNVAGTRLDLEETPRQLREPVNFEGVEEIFRLSGIFLYMSVTS